MEGRETAEEADQVVSTLVTKELHELLRLVVGEDGGERENPSKGTKTENAGTVCSVCMARKKQYFSLYPNTCDNNKSNQTFP